MIRMSHLRSTLTLFSFFGLFIILVKSKVTVSIKTWWVISATVLPGFTHTTLYAALQRIQGVVLFMNSTKPQYAHHGPTSLVRIS